MVDTKVLIGVLTGEYARRADFYDYFNQLTKPEGSIMMFCHDRSPAKGRNLIIEQALIHNCTHVLFIDDDMAFKSEVLNQLLAHDLPIVSGLYFSRAYPHQPLIFDEADETGACLYSYLTGKEPNLKPIVAAGFGFLLVNTNVFKAMKKPWVRLGELNNEEWCDDIGFFNRVRQELNSPIFCDMEVMCGHIGTMIVWPVKKDGVWMTGYDTSGRGMISTPQLTPELISESEAKTRGIS